MQYTFHSTGRYKDVKKSNSATAAPVLLSFYLCLVCAVGLWLVYAAVYAVPTIAALALVSTSAASLLGITYIFGATYYQHKPPPRTLKEIEQGDGNVAKAASYELIRTIGPTKNPASESDLMRAAANILAHPEVRSILRRFEVDGALLGQEIAKSVVPVDTWDQFIQRMIANAKSARRQYISIGDALQALLDHANIQNYLRNFGIGEKDIDFAAWWYEIERENARKRQWWRKENLLKVEGVGRSWASGYTPFVDQFSRIPPTNIWEHSLIGHEVKINELIDTLARQRQSNVLLTGQPGVGRIGIIKELINRIQTNTAHPELNGERVIYLHLGELVAQGNTSAGQQSVIARALREIERAGDIITIVDGLNTVLSQTSGQGLDMTDLLLPFLASGKTRVVVIASSREYHQYLQPNGEIMHYFDVVQAPSLSTHSTLMRLALAAPRIEQRAGIFIPYGTLRQLVRSVESIMPQVPFPERAFDFLEEAIVYAQNRRDKVLKPEHIYDIISRKLGVDFRGISAEEQNKLLNLADVMHQRIVNQNQAITTLSHAMIRARAQVRSRNRPIGVFLFLGPTGVGKTETAKTLAETYFGSKRNLSRLDMSEFQGSDAVQKLIGSVENPNGRLTSLNSESPFTVLLLDEFEKASPQVHQLFLQVFDEGHITDSIGTKYSFVHTIIIATSNAGAEMIRQNVSHGNVPENFEKQLRDHILEENIFRPELLNRFDAVVTFTPLTEDHIKQVAKLLLRDLNQRLDEQHGVTVAITDELIGYLAEIGYNPEFGARPMLRAVQDSVEYAVANQIVRGQTKPGQVITLSPHSLRETATTSAPSNA